MKLLDDLVHRFSHVSPIYNWIYPMAGVPRRSVYASDVAPLIAGAPSRAAGARALYLHIPFCETICTFCPLVKSPLDDEAQLDTYVRALEKEIALKGRDPEVMRLPIRAVFFGGGSPSLLRPDDIRRIGKALRDAFNLEAVEEFSVEMEAKSIAPEKLSAFREIGVTHARFGLQTFASRHRGIFNLTANVEQLEQAPSSLSAYFPHVSCDMLYGLNGQTAEEFIEDIERVTALELDNIDFYPLNIYVTQKKLHRTYAQERLTPISGMTKLYMTKVLREAMRGKGYLPHNGHGFVKVDGKELAQNPVVTRQYAFRYHQHVYGPDDAEYIGIGNSAQSYLAGHTISNITSRERYVKALLEDSVCPVVVVDHSDHVNAAKAVAISLPYLGHISRSRVRWDALPDTTRERLDELITHELIEADHDELRLTMDGWLWYVNLMYYLSPREEQAALGKLMLQGERGRLRPGETEWLTVAA